MVEVTAAELKALLEYCWWNPDVVCIVLLTPMWRGYIRKSKAPQSTAGQYNSDRLGLS